jgi:membrane peptidoglycan carboxypeptidase
LVWRAQQGATEDDVPGFTRPLPHRDRRLDGGNDSSGNDSSGNDSGRNQPGQAEPRPQRPRSRGRRYLRRAAITVVTLVAIFAIGVATLLLATPSATDATKLAAQQAAEHGIAYPGPPVPANFARPLIATEDHRFYSEPGVDVLAVGRVAEGKITGSQDQGGATIEQQLAKLLYTPNQTGVAAELKQVALAVKLNFTYSKAEILRLYAEVAYYGHGYYGLEAASCGYFGRPAARLTVVQGAMLAGVVNAPSADDPISNPVNARARLAHVIARMVAVGDLTQAQGTAVLRTSLGIVPRDQAGC